MNNIITIKTISEIIHVCCIRNTAPVITGNHICPLCVPFVSLFSFVELYLLFVQWFSSCAVCVLLLLLLLLLLFYRHTAHFCESFIRGLAVSVSQSMKSTQEMSRNKFTKFEVNNRTEGLKNFSN